MAAKPPQNRPDFKRLPQLNRAVHLTLLGLWAERLSRAFWPLWVILLCCFAALAFGLHRYGSLFTLQIALGLIGLATLAALIFGLRHFRRPQRAEALARLDASLPGRPIAALSDDQLIGHDDPASAMVWRAHIARMTERAKSAKPVAPDLQLSARDPYALRYVALTAAVMAALFGSIWRAGEVTGLGAGPAEAIPNVAAWEAWARPPAYTGKPRLYLNDITAPGFEVPIGSKIQIRFYGSTPALSINQTIAQPSPEPAQTETAETEVAANRPQGLAGLTELTVSQSGQLSLEGPGGRSWEVTVTPDLVPKVLISAPITREADGRFKQPYEASDDYGVTAGEVTLALDIPRVTRSHGLAIEPEAIAPIVLDLPMPMTGKRDKIKDIFIDDLSKSLLANMPVTLSFAVSDALAQQGVSAPQSVILPGKRFFEPQAAAVIELRRDLMWNRANAPRVSQILKALVNRPDELPRAQNAAKRTRVLIRALDQELALGPLSTAFRDEAVEELWQIAFMFETGDLGTAAERLQRAQDRLEEAIRNGASPEEIDELMKDMQQAMRDYTRELGKQAENAPPQSGGEGGQTITGDQLQQMLDKIEELMKEGKTAEAMALMEELRKLMENLQVQQGQGQGEGGEGQGGAMGELRDTLRDQQGLSDEAYRDMQRSRNGEEGSNPEDFAQRQQELRERLQGLQNGQLPGDGTAETEAGRDKLGRAEEAMREAERRLKDGDLSGALDKQAEAMREMREGARDLEEGERKKNREAGGDGGTNEPRGAERVDPNATDPLGREPGDSARIGSDRNMVENTPDERAKKLLDEIRRRSGEATRPEGELDYLKRLLDLF